MARKLVASTIEWDREAIEEIKKRKGGLGKWREGVMHKVRGIEVVHFPIDGNWSLCGRISRPIRLTSDWKEVTCKMCWKKR
jgi:hypothetical protein